MSEAIERPRLRPSVDATAVEQDGRQMMVLFDAAGLVPGNIALTPGAFMIATMINGENTLDDIRRGFAERFGQPLPATQLVELILQLDSNGMLDSPLFRTRYKRLVMEYREAPVRISASTDDQVDVDELRSELLSIVDEGASAANGQQVAGLIAPHLDYERGRPCYAEAYAQIKGQDDIERFVILGANHFGLSPTAVWTVKDFQTPLGQARTDRDFIDKLGRRCGFDLGAHELDHLREHSIELQVMILQAMMGDRPVRIVPILCPDICGPTGINPYESDGPGLDKVAAALAEVIADAPGRTCVIAGADLSHVGRRFGDEGELTDEFLRAVEDEDRALLDLIQACNADAVVARLRQTKNAHRVCSGGGLYVLLKLLADLPVRMLKYHQAVTREENIAVTCAAAAVLADGSGE